MASYTITDILGTDNVASSRKEIASNFKILVDGLNKIETFLNTSPNGGDLNIANASFKRYTKLATDTILNCEAKITTVNLAVTDNLTIGGTSNITGILTTSNDATIGNNLSVTNNVTIGNQLVMSIDAAVINSSDGVAPAIHKSCVTINWNGTTANIGNTSVANGQLLIIRNTGSTPGTVLTIQSVGTPLFSFTVPADITKVKFILQFANGAWELISIIGATIS